MNLHLPSIKTLEFCFSWLETERADLLPAARWLVLGPRLFRLLRQTPRPATAQLTELLRFLYRRDPRSTEVFEHLASETSAGREALVELAVDKLLELDGWHHPSQVLPHPRPDPEELLRACSDRLRRARGRDQSGERLDEVLCKVRRAVRIAEEARLNRIRQRTRRPR